MTKYKHKPTGKIAELVHRRMYMDTCTSSYRIKGCILEEVPIWVVENSSDWEKIEEILFTTYDGFGLKKGDMAYGVRTEYKNWEISDISIQKEGELGNAFGWIWFSSRQMRIDFMAWNEPRLSLSNVMKTLKQWSIVIPDDVLYAIESQLNK